MKIKKTVFSEIMAGHFTVKVRKNIHFIIKKKIFDVI